MPKIFELFGYPLSAQTQEAQQCRKQAHCPFMGSACDGGGNRYLSHIDIPAKSPLRKYFGNRERVEAGVCSIQLVDGEAPWIVCPRRLLILGHEKAAARAHQQETETEVLRLLGYSSGTKLGVWSEVKLQFAEIVDDDDKSFNYTFDYIVMPVGSISQENLVATLGNDWRAWRRVFERGGYAIARRDGEDFVEDCPIGIPHIIEVMTSSTSGGNKTKRTTIPQAFEDAILGKEHTAPGINKRQVWARMVSQLIVKSEVAMAWGGRALWIIQDTLAAYISASTALNLQNFIAEHTNEVNLLSFSYGDQYANASDVIKLRPDKLFAGPISASGAKAKPSFQDMIRAPIRPALKRLLARLAESKPVNTIVVP
jgi:hypothetical protein